MIQRTSTTAWAGLIAVTLAVALVGCESPQARREQQQAVAREHTSTARQNLESGKLDEALAWFRKALEADPKNVEAQLGVGEVFEAKGDYALAAEEYKKAQQIAPSSFQANYKLGLMYHLLNKLRDAIATYLAALTVDPGNFEANINISSAYAQLDRPELGLPYAERAVQIMPDSQQAHVNLGELYASVGKFEQAVAAFRAAAERGDLEPPVVVGLVNSLIQLQRYQRAINVLTTAIQTTPDEPRYHERLGYLQFKLGDYSKSEAAYREALTYAESDPAALNGLGVNLMTKYLRTGRNDFAVRNQAIAMWRKSVRTNPNQPRIIDLIHRYANL